MFLSNQPHDRSESDREQEKLMRSIIIALFSLVLVLASFSSARAQEPCDCQVIGARIIELRVQICKMAKAAESSGSVQDKKNIKNMEAAAERLQAELKLAKEAAKFCGCFK